MSAVQSTQEKRAAQRKRVGRIVPFSVQSNRRERDEHELPRDRCLGTKVDPLINEAFVAEARRRGIPKAALLGKLIELIVNDGLFDAMLDERAA